MSLDDWIEGHAQQTPAKPAIRSPGRDLSYARLSQLVRTVATALADSGVRRGDCVAWLGYNSAEMIALLSACARLGARFMPLNWRLAAPEHREMLANCRPAALFAESDFVAQADTARDELDAVALVSLGEAPPGWRSWNDFLARAVGQPVPPPAADPDTPLLVCYTSGSTGKPKGVVLTQAAIAANAINSIAMHDMVADDVILTTLPLFHVGGLNNQTTPALCAGCTIVLHPRFEVEATFDAIENDNVTLTVLVPAQFEAMMAHPRWTTADFSHLRMITTGSTIVPEKLIRAVHERGVPMVQVYGATETCPIAACQKAVDAERVGSAGRVARMCELRIVDDFARDVPSGTTGEILVRGPNVMLGYWNDQEATDAVLVDGWFHTGDIGHFDGDGYLYVDGRKKDMIISGSENIYPAEIENVLIESPDIAEASVVGREDERWGEIVVAVVVRSPGSRIDAQQVLALLDGRIARYKHPKDVVFVDTLPKTALGKVRKEEVRRFAAQDATPQSQPAG